MSLNIGSPKVLVQLDKPDLIKWFDNMAVIQSKTPDWPEYNAKQALRESPHVQIKTDSKIVEDFIDY